MNNQSKTSFLVKIDYTRNASFQGSIHWIEESKVTRFKSALEMLMLIQTAQQESKYLDWDSVETIIDINTHFDRQKK